MNDWSWLAAAAAAALWLWRWRRGRAALAAAHAAAAAAAAEQRQAAAELARAEAALAGAQDGLIVLDGELRVVVANAAAQQLAGLPAQGARGRPLRELLAWPRLHAALQRCQRDGTAADFEIEVGGGAEPRPLAVRVRPLPARGCVVGLDDQSRLKRLESLRRDFVANVSHELKTPLAAIQGFVETLQDDPGMPEATRVRFLERIARQTDRLKTLVGDLLTLSRLDEEHALGEDVPPCDLAAVVRETLRDLQPLAERRRLRLGRALPEGTVWIRADREALRQVVGNLVDNAIKYTPEGGRVDVRCRAEAGIARVEVADTGIGLSPADQERVFERFYRVDRARSREVGGTGLGLSIVKNTVRSLGGEVGVQSQLGAGSTFWVQLPLAPTAPAGDGDPAGVTG